MSAGAGEEQEVKVSPHSYPVTLSANTFCASEQPSHSLAASQSHLTVPLQNGLPPPCTQLQAHAVSAETGGFTGQEEETADTADSGGSEGDPFLTPEDSAQGNASAAGSDYPSQISTGAHQPALTHPDRVSLGSISAGPVSAGDTAELLGVQFGSAAAVVDVVRFLASSTSASGVSRRADSASASIGGLAAEVCIVDSERPMPGKNKKAVVDWAGDDASAGDAASAASSSTRGSGVAVIQPKTEAAMRAVGGLAAADGSGGGGRLDAEACRGEVDAQDMEPEQAAKHPGDRKRTALEKLKGRLRSRQQNAVSRSRHVSSYASASAVQDS